MWTYRQNLSQTIVDVSQVGRVWASRRTVSRGGSGKRMPLPLCIPSMTTSGRDLDVTPGSSGPDPPPVVGPVAIPAVESMDVVKLSSPPLSGQLSPASLQMVAWEDLGDSSVPLSPNRVQAGRSQDVPDEGSLFHVSPVSPGSDVFMALPVYSLPSGLAYMPGQSSVQTVLASGISSRPEVWSSALAPPMDTEDSSLLATGLPGCPSVCRSSSVCRSRLACCTIRRRFG